MTRIDRACALPAPVLTRHPDEVTVYAFGPFRLEPRERRLLRDGQPVVLTGKAFDMLCLLVEGAGTLQTQASLMDRLWPDVVVEQNNLQSNVSIVRRALADAPGVEIHTIRGRGYRFVGDVRESVDSNRSIVTPSQHIHFCRGQDGARIAYATLGDGPPLVKAANWLSHLELDGGSPIWTHWLELLSRGRRLIRYDARGNGLSDWDPPSITFENFVNDLGAVFDAAKVARAPVLGISQGAAAAVAYAARNPERVSALVLVGGCARGWRVKGSTALHERFEAMMTLMRQGWGGENAAFRQIFTTAFFPDAATEHVEWFNELQRTTASPANAAAILSALGDVDVRSEVERVHVPTLVVHSRFDAVVPMKDGIELASGIAGARFVPIDSPNHVLLAGEPGWKHFAREFERFLSE